MDEKDFDAHLREHTLMSDAHRRDHEQLAEELKETARELSMNVRETAERLAESLRSTAETHWKNHEREHQANDRALDKAEEAVNERLEGMNEFREQLNMQAGTFMTRESADQQHKSQDDKINAIQKWIDGAVGKSAGMAPMVTLGLAVITAVVVAVAVTFFTGTR